jgi:photosystem II stability/assembly factor-like uncharacterized protein
MKKITILLMCLFAFTGNAYSQAGWTVVNTGSEYFWSSHFVNEYTGWVAGSSGKIKKTTNGGATWFYQESGTGESIIYINFLNTNTGWIAAHGGVIKKTTDGGDTWNMQTSGISANTFQTSFADSQVGWFSSDAGVKKTTDGGATWNLNLDHYGIYSVYFLNQYTGWAGANNATVFKTTNGGESWSPQNFSPNITVVSFYFVNQNTGWAVGYNGLIFKTTNAGVDWVRQYHNAVNATQFRSVVFTDNTGMNGWIAGYNGVILKTTNGGDNWYKQNVPHTGDFTSIRFINSLTGWAAGSNGKIIKTTDGGLTGFTSLSSEVPSDYYVEQNYPNPFNPKTVISFGVPNTSAVKVSVYDITGKELQVLLNENISAGNYEVQWDASRYSSGIYYYTISAGDFVKTMKMALVK